MRREPTWVTGPLGLLLIISAGACSGGDAMSPERPAMVSGAWAGTITLTNKNVTSSFETGGPVSVTISQSDASATGQFRATDVSGAFAAVITGADLDGTLTLHGTDGCRAAAPMHGVVDSSALRLNVPTIGAGTCRWGGSSLRLTLQRS
jgi:hypothetical protein